MDIEVKPPKAAAVAVEKTVEVYLLEAWYDGASATAYDSGRTIEVTETIAEMLVNLGTAELVEPEKA